MKSLKNVFILLLTLLIIAGSAIVTFVGIGSRGGDYSDRFGVLNIKLGLDLAGGVSITYHAEEGSNPSSSQMEGALAVIQNRLDSKGYTEAQAYLDGTDRIRVEIPGVKDASAAVEDIGKTAMLTFVGFDWDDIKDSSIMDKYYDLYVQDAIAALKEQDGEDAEYSEDELLKEAKTYLPQQAYYTVMTYPEILTDALEAGLAEEVLTGSDVDDASYQRGQLSQNGAVQSYVKLELNSEGKEKFAEATEKYKGKYIAIRLDETVCSMPTVNSVITDGVAQITGMSGEEEAKSLAADIRGGALPVRLVDLEHNSVGATLGQDAMQTSVTAAIIGFILILIFMIVYYRIPGVAASIALLFYITLELFFINLLDITLTLPGIAGIILSIGMAVDANVIIFARINEELRGGRDLLVSIESGFKKALSAILDGNVTTLIAAAVLWFLGSGTIKGFAQTLALGIVISMFTALVVTRLLLKQSVALISKNPKLYRSIRGKKA